MALADYLSLLGPAFFIIAVVIIVWKLMEWSQRRAAVVPGYEREFEKRYFPKEEHFREQAEMIQRALEKRKAREAPEEAALMREAREVEVLEEYETILTSAEEDLAVSVRQTIASERAAEDKEAALLSAMVGYGNEIERALSQMGSMEAIDSAGRRYVIGLMRAIANACLEIAKTEYQANVGRMRFISSLIKDVEVMMDVVSRAKRLSKDATRLDRRLGKKLGAGIIEKVKAVLTIKRAKLRALQASLMAARAAKNEPLIEQLSVQIAELKQEIGMIENELYRLTSMQAQLAAALKQVGKVLADIKKILAVIAGAEKQVTAREKAILQFESAFTSGLEKLEAAARSFGVAIAQLEKEAIQVAEEAPITATTGVGGVFTEMLNLQTSTLRFHTEGTRPFIETLQNVLRDAEPLNPLMQGLHAAFQDVSRAFDALSAAAAKIIGAIPSNEERAYAALESSIEAMAVREAPAHATAMQVALNALQISKSETEKLITTITNINQRTLSTEKQVLGELSRALNAIVTNKVRVNKEFETQAAQFTSQIASAQKTLAAARKAA
jgi:hypothetical protein